MSEIIKSMELVRGNEFWEGRHFPGSDFFYVTQGKGEHETHGAMFKPTQDHLAFIARKMIEGGYIVTHINDKPVEQDVSFDFDFMAELETL